MTHLGRIPTSCLVPTSESTQIFTQGPRSIHLLNEYLTMRNEMRTKQKDLWTQFNQKWSSKVESIMACHLKDDRNLKEIACSLSGLGEVLERKHRTFVENVDNGPIQQIKEYLDNSRTTSANEAQMIADDWLSIEQFEIHRAGVAIFALMEYLFEEKDALQYKRQMEEILEKISEKLKNHKISDHLLNFRKDLTQVHLFPDTQIGGETAKKSDSRHKDAVEVTGPSPDNQQSSSTPAGQTTVSTDESRPELPREPLVILPVRVKVYGLEAYTATREDEISFKRGQKVYMVSAPNSGVAYGYIKKGFLKKEKSYGFFPVNQVSSKRKKGFFRNPFKKS